MELVSLTNEGGPARKCQNMNDDDDDDDDDVGCGCCFVVVSFKVFINFVSRTCMSSHDDFKVS